MPAAGSRRPGGAGAGRGPAGGRPPAGRDSGRRSRRSAGRRRVGPARCSAASRAGRTTWTEYPPASGSSARAEHDRFPSPSTRSGLPAVLGPLDPGVGHGASGWACVAAISRTEIGNGAGGSARRGVRCLAGSAPEPSAGGRAGRSPARRGRERDRGTGPSATRARRPVPVGPPEGPGMALRAVVRPRDRPEIFAGLDDVRAAPGRGLTACGPARAGPRGRGRGGSIPSGRRPAAGTCGASPVRSAPRPGRSCGPGCRGSAGSPSRSPRKAAEIPRRRRGPGSPRASRPGARGHPARWSGRRVPGLPDGAGPGAEIRPGAAGAEGDETRTRVPVRWQAAAARASRRPAPGPESRAAGATPDPRSGCRGHAIVLPGRILRPDVRRQQDDQLPPDIPLLLEPEEVAQGRDPGEARAGPAADSRLRLPSGRR